MVFGFGKAVSQAGSGRSVERVDLHHLQALTEGSCFGKRLAMMEGT